MIVNEIGFKEGNDIDRPCKKARTSLGIRC